MCMLSLLSPGVEISIRLAVRETDTEISEIYETSCLVRCSKLPGGQNLCLWFIAAFELDSYSMGSM